MPLLGYQLAYNSKENISCYNAGADSASGLDFTPIPCAGSDAATVLGLEWAIPCSENGVSVTGFNYQKATGTTKPRADAVKVITVQVNRDGGKYGRWLVPDSYLLSDFVAACCAGCTPVPSVTIPAPFILSGDCVLATPTIPGCVYNGSFYVPALTGGNTTFTATPFGYDALGAPIVFSPATSTGTTVALLAASMQTNWASEMGTATFVATGNSIDWAATIAKTFGVVIVQS